MIVELSGKTRHGKNRVNEHGKMWKVIRENSIGEFLVESMKDKDLRWALREHFEVKIVSK